METLKIDQRKRIVIIALLVGVLLGLLSFNAVIADKFKDERRSPYPKYKVNKYGETYGSDQYADSLEEEPDLILAQGVDGTVGYLRYEDLFGDMPKTPEEALEYNKRNDIPETIPLYASDGRTVIGQFKRDGKTFVASSEEEVEEIIKEFEEKETEGEFDD
ncbi:MAG: peptidase M56 BlaR1 [Actinomycetota bacterium]|nr:peptidase M56 BlaR1 [Actinomycetota bacterium]